MGMRKSTILRDLAQYLDRYADTLNAVPELAHIGQHFRSDSQWLHEVAAIWLPTESPLPSVKSMIGILGELKNG